MCPDLQLKAAELNQTLSRRDGTPEKSLKEMKEEIQAMLAEMRKRQLEGKKSIAEEEMEYGHTCHEHSQTHTHVQVMHLSPTHTKKNRFLRKVSKSTIPLSDKDFCEHAHMHEKQLNFLINEVKNMQRGKK